MLQVSSASRADTLAAALAELLRETPEDPMCPEWVAVPSVAMGRWLALELARWLGASGPAAGDGVAANITFAFPDSLRLAVLEAGRGAPDDPWRVDSLAWAVLEVLAANGDDKRLSPVNQLAPGATWFGRARRLADLLDRYAVRRPELVMRWQQGLDLDAGGARLEPESRWQPHLWRLVRAQLGVPSPPERMEGLLAALRSGTLELGLPQRLAFFGLTTLPGGAPFLELLDAAAVGRELHLMLLDPSPATAARVRSAARKDPGRVPRLRSEDTSERSVRHPLLRSWGRPYQERAVLLAGAERVLDERVLDPAPARDTTGESLLQRLQADLRSGDRPAGDFEPRPGDRSFQVHSCHGQARQVEVLRDAILHLLADDPTLSENDVVVLCPAIEQFAPLVEAGFGTSADRIGERRVPTGTDGGGSAPRLFYRITDRSLRETSPLLAGLDFLLSVVSGRFGASEVLELASLALVRRRFGLSDEAISTIADWVEQTHVHWGLDGEQRARFGMPAEYGANSWQAALDRLLAGIAITEDALSLGPSDVAPLGIEGDDVAVAGRLAELVSALGDLERDARHPRTVSLWCETLAGAVERFFRPDAEEQRQLEQFRWLMADIADKALLGGRQETFELSLADLRRLLAERLKGAPRRAEFFRGGVTVSSLTPLRWIGFRVVCLLGLDETTVATARPPEGDDLAAALALVGDPDARAEVRQALLEAVLAAGDHLLITRTGHNVRTNQEVPPATVLAELRDTVLATVAPAVRAEAWGRIETVHPCQGFDERCFVDGALGVGGAWSFDGGALAGARARTQRGEGRPRLFDARLSQLPEPDGIIRLEDLRRFLDNPVRAFVRSRLQLVLTDPDPVRSDNLSTSMAPLDEWSAADRLIAARVAGLSPELWRRHERALGTLGAGGFGDLQLDGLEEDVDELMAEAAALGVRPRPTDRLQVDVALDGSTRLVGDVTGSSAPPFEGPVVVGTSRVDAKRRMRAWLELMALVATDPDRPWRSLLIGRAETGRKVVHRVLVPKGDSPSDRRRVALEGLGVAVDCYRRGLREAVPLFGHVSRQLFLGKRLDWDDECKKDPALRLVFGHLDEDDLRELPARAEDPPGRCPERAKRWAVYLWGAVAASVVETR